MATLKVMHWFDIPAQVSTRVGRKNQRYRLSDRFADAIERATYRVVKKQGKDALFDPWHLVDQPFSGDVHDAANALIARLESDYSDDVLEGLARNSGKHPSAIAGEDDACA